MGVLFGPAIGGALMLVTGPPAGLFVNALIYLPLTIWLLTVPYTGHSREGAAPSRRAVSWRDAIDTLHQVSSIRPIITMVALGGCASFFVGSAFQRRCRNSPMILVPSKPISRTARYWQPTRRAPSSASFTRR